VGQWEYYALYKVNAKWNSSKSSFINANVAIRGNRRFQTLVLMFLCLSSEQHKVFLVFRPQHFT